MSWQPYFQPMPVLVVSFGAPVVRSFDFTTRPWRPRLGSTHRKELLKAEYPPIDWLPPRSTTSGSWCRKSTHGLFTCSHIPLRVELTEV